MPQATQFLPGSVALSLSTTLNETLLDDAASEQERELVETLDRWMRSAPALDQRLVRIAAQENPLRRRAQFWTLIAEQEREARRRLLAGVIAAAYREDAAGLRILFSFLCGRPLTAQHPEQISTLRHVHSLGRRLLFHSPPRDEEEASWLMQLQDRIPPCADYGEFHAALDSLCEDLGKTIGTGRSFPHPLPESDANLMNLEGRAASLRGARLVDQVGDYDVQALARFLPMVVALDEWQGDLQALVDRGPVALKHPLEQYLGDEELSGWRRHLAEAEDLPGRLISNWVHWMDGTEMVGNEPAAWVGLLRTLSEYRYRKTIYAALLLPLRWRSRRLGLSTRPPVELFRARAISKGESLYWVDLNELLWAEWVNPDGRPMSADGWRRDESPLMLLRSRVQDDAFCDRILSNEQWNQRPGIVECIARGSRSLRVLLRIARERRLHTGATNRNVPISLLENPINIPISALRPFFAPRYITRHDFSRLARGDAGIRKEISSEARNQMRRN